MSSFSILCGGLHSHMCSIKGKTIPSVCVWLGLRLLGIPLGQRLACFNLSWIGQLSFLPTKSGYNRCVIHFASFFPPIRTLELWHYKTDSHKFRNDTAVEITRIKCKERCNGESIAQKKKLCLINNVIWKETRGILAANNNSKCECTLAVLCEKSAARRPVSEKWATAKRVMWTKLMKTTWLSGMHM